MIITNNKILIDAAKRNYELFKVPTRDVQTEKKERKYTLEDLAKLDYITSSNKIGEIVNLSQELNSLLWHTVSLSNNPIEEQYDSIKQIYYDTCQLDVMSNIEIDSAKKIFPINNTKELNKLREKYKDILLSDDGEKKRMPSFMGYIAELKGYRDDDKKSYEKYNTAMDYLHECIDKGRSSRSKGSGFKKLSDIFKPDDFNNNLVYKKLVTKIIAKGKSKLRYINSLYRNNNLDYSEKERLSNNSKKEFLYEINNMKINECTMYRILWHMDNNNDFSLRSFLFYILFNYKNNIIINMLNNYDKIDTYLEEKNNGDIVIYNKKYIKNFPI